MTHLESVPVDERWLGMDKRGIPYAVVALVLMVALHWGEPALDNATKWSNPTVAGDVIDLGRDIRITPPVGWQLEQGTRTTENPVVPVNADAAAVTLSNGAVTMTLAGANWSGTADELLDQYNTVRETSDEEADQLFAVSGERATFVTSSGVTGVQEAYSSAEGDGRVFAFVVDDGSGGTVGVVVSATAADGSLGQYDSQIQNFVSSLTTTEAAR